MRRSGTGCGHDDLTNPALELDDLPPLDLVLLSHHHGDHFDPEVVERLAKDLPIVTEPHSARRLTAQGFTRPLALRTWQTMTVRRGSTWVRITATPAKHAPGPLRWLLPHVMGSILEFGRSDDVHFVVYVTGDTLFHDQLAEIPRRYPAIDLCVIHLGGTRIAGVLLTMDAVQGVRTLRLVRPRVAIPVHFDDYTVFRSPLAEFRELAGAGELATEIHYLDRGESYQLPPLFTDP